MAGEAAAREPRPDTVADRSVHPATVFLRFIKEAPSTLLALPAGITFASNGDFTRALIVAAGAGVIFLFVSWLAWRRFRYGVGEREIVIESGILTRTRRSIPFDRIQDVDVERALLQRIFGLARVRIETGAGGKDEGLLDSITLAEAARLRDAVETWRREERSIPVAAPAAGEAPAASAEAGTETLLFEMGLPRVMQLGLFNFSLVYLAGIFAFLQTFERLLPFDIYDPARWTGLAERHITGRFTPAAIGAVLVLAMLLGVLAGVARTVSRDYGFRLTLEGSRLRRQRGLFTRSEVVIPTRRVQLAEVRTGPVRRAFGWFALSLQTLGAGGDAGGRQSAAPFAKASEMGPIFALAGLRLPDRGELLPVSRRHALRVLATALPLPLAAILIGALFWPPVLFFLAALPLIGAGAMLDRRFHLYGLAEGKLFVTRGLWRQHLWIVPLGNVEALSLSRSPLQRRLGLATLAIDSAGAPLLNIPRVTDLRTDDARALMRAIGEGRAAYSGRKSGTER
jgi:putative membrane protein